MENLVNHEVVENFIQSRENETPFAGVFGYGSGVFHQKGYSLQKKSMIDLILVVKNKNTWQQENLRRNPTDYPKSARILFSNINLERISYLTGVTYQTHIAFEGYLFKYGVVSEQDFLNEMTTWNRQGENHKWNTFFLPGRFQKPIRPYRCDENLVKAIQKNRELALLIALYTLKESKMTLTGLYKHLCNLSYLGDIRMLFVENPNKVSNIVDASFPLFVKIYGMQTEYFHTNVDGTISIHYSTVTKKLEEYLPQDMEKKKVLEKSNGSELILKRIQKINRRESIIQPAIGVLTAGPVTSLKYVHEKMLKKEKRIR